MNEAELAKRTGRPVLSEGALAVRMRFSDPWALLNASTEDIKEVGQVFPREQVGDLVGLIRGFRRLYVLLACGVGQAGDAGQANEDLQRFDEEQKRVGDLLAEHGIGWRLEFRPGPKGATPGWAPTETSEVLFEALRDHFLALVRGLERANPSKVYICEVCGKIGRSRQRNRRFCGGTCRSRAYRSSVPRDTLPGGQGARLSPLWPQEPECAVDRSEEGSAEGDE